MTISGWTLERTCEDCELLGSCPSVGICGREARPEDVVAVLDRAKALETLPRTEAYLWAGWATGRRFRDYDTASPVALLVQLATEAAELLNGTGGGTPTVRVMRARVLGIQLDWALARVQTQSCPFRDGEMCPTPGGCLGMCRNVPVTPDLKSAVK